MSSFESPCLYDCANDGCISLSRDGRYVYVGDAGDVIDTATRTVVTRLPTLANTRKFIEIDFNASGKPIFSPTSRSGIGYVTR
jgi:YVTN family beta-propeller protein